MGRRPTGNPRGRPAYPGLTPAEERVLDGVRRGLSNEQIAAELGVSWTTVKYHVANILGKLNVESREDLVEGLDNSAARGRWWHLTGAGAATRPRPRAVVATTAAFAVVGALAVALLTSATGGRVEQARGGAPSPGITRASPAPSTPASVTPIPTATEAPAPGVAALLARPLDLPRVAPGEPCPVTPGRDASPAVSSGSGAGPMVTSAGSGYVPLWPHPEAPGWFGTKIAWTLEKVVAGPVVLRGAQIDGPGLLRWEDPPATSPDWTDMDALLVGVTGNRAYRSGISGMPVSEPGCYAVQVDGEGFQQHIVFEARLEPSPGSLAVSATNPTGLRLAFAGWGLDDAGTFLVDATGIYGRLPSGQFEWLPGGHSLLVASSPQLLVVGEDGRASVLLTGGVMAASPDPTGSKISVDSWDGNWMTLSIASATTGDVERVPATSGVPSWKGKWSPDGALLAFMTEQDGDPEVHMVDRDGMAERRLTDNPGFDGYPTWSPDGSLIAWESTRDFRRGIWLMDADGGNQRQLAPTADAVDWFPAWSPDGSRIAFCSDRDGGWRIYTMAADGSDVRQVSVGPGSEWAPQWSPDGEWIGFISNRSGSPELWVVRPDGSDLQRVTTTAGGFVDQFAWAPLH